MQSAPITLWEVIGFFGTFLFFSRWVLQMLNSHRAGKPVVTKSFWYVSIVGNIFILSYFVFGEFNRVGILSNLLPMFVAGYNLWLLNTNPQPR